MINRDIWSRFKGISKCNVMSIMLCHVNNAIIGTNYLVGRPISVYHIKSFIHVLIKSFVSSSQKQEQNATIKVFFRSFCHLPVSMNVWPYFMLVLKMSWCCYSNYFVRVHQSVEHFKYQYSFNSLQWCQHVTQWSQLIITCVTLLCWRFYQCDQSQHLVITDLRTKRATWAQSYRWIGYNLHAIPFSFEQWYSVQSASMKYEVTMKVKMKGVL